MFPLELIDEVTLTMIMSTSCLLRDGAQKWGTVVVSGFQASQDMMGAIVGHESGIQPFRLKVYTPMRQYAEFGVSCPGFIRAVARISGLFLVVLVCIASISSYGVAGVCCDEMTIGLEPVVFKVLLRDAQTLEPIAGAAIEVLDAGTGECRANMVSNEDGEVELTRVSEGLSLVLNVSASGYVSDVFQTRCCEDVHDIYLSPQTGNERVVLPGERLDGMEYFVQDGDLEYSDTDVDYLFCLSEPSLIQKLVIIEYDGDNDLCDSSSACCGKCSISVSYVLENGRAVSHPDRIIPSGDEEDKEHMIDVGAVLPDTTVKCITVMPVGESGHFNEFGGSWLIREMYVTTVDVVR